MYDLAVVRSGAFLKIISKENALKSNLKVYTENKSLDIDQIITTVIKLKHIDAASLEQKMKPFYRCKSCTFTHFYPPSNTVVISDYGSNIKKFINIIKNMDVPAIEEIIFKVFPIKHARAELLSKIINTLLVPSRSRVYRSSSGSRSVKTQKSPNIKSLSHDERTNSIIVMGNKAGINKVKNLIQQLDYYKDPELAGGIYVYKVKHGTAEELAATLNELMGNSTPSSSKQKTKSTLPTIKGSKKSLSRPLSRLKNISTAQAFKDVNIIAEKNTNSLLIVSNKYNYETILGILKKVDISRNQVFVKSIIMELSTDRNNDWQIANYFFPKKGGGVSRIGYGLKSLQDLASPSGATLFFPLSILNKIRPLDLDLPDTNTKIGSLLKMNNITGLDKSRNS